MCVCLLLSGCLTYQEYSFTFDYNTGKVEKVYHDLRSQKGFDEKDYSIEKDWIGLKESVTEHFGEGLDVDVIKPIKAELFQEGDVLSGKEVLKVQLPKAFPSKVAILERLHADGDLNDQLKLQALNSEIFLYAGNNEIKSTNGKVIKTDKNNMIVWPEDQTEFEFTLESDTKGGKSLLPFYLEEQKTENKK